MKSSVRDQIQGRQGKAKVRTALNRRDRRAAKIAVRLGRETLVRPTERLERVLV